jgi:hypothetical protein
MIDPQIEKAARDLSARAGQWVRDELARAGLSKEEVDDVMRKAHEGIRIYGLKEVNDDWIKRNEELNPKCPRCGVGVDDDGDGDCGVCAKWPSPRIPTDVDFLNRVGEAMQHRSESNETILNVILAVNSLAWRSK